MTIKKTAALLDRWAKSRNKKLTFDKLRRTNVARCEEAFHKINRWDPMQWACALAGEVGELCNLLKKKYGCKENIPLEDIGRELADAQTYLDLLAARVGLDLGEWTIRKFNEVSFKRNSNRRL